MRRSGVGQERAGSDLVKTGAIVNPATERAFWSVHRHLLVPNLETKVARSNRLVSLLVGW